MTSEERARDLWRRADEAFALLDGLEPREIPKHAFDYAAALAQAATTIELGLLLERLSHPVQWITTAEEDAMVRHAEKDTAR